MGARNYVTAVDAAQKRKDFCFLEGADTHKIMDDFKNGKLMCAGLENWIFLLYSV